MGKQTNAISYVWNDKWLLAKALLMLSLTRLGLLFLPYRMILAIFSLRDSNPSLHPITPADLPYCRRIVRAIRTAGRRVLGERPCLPESLVVQYLLAKKGIQTDLEIGVSKEDGGELTAHAWLESSGMIVIGGRLSPRIYSRIQPLIP